MYWESEEESKEICFTCSVLFVAAAVRISINTTNNGEEEKEEEGMIITVTNNFICGGLKRNTS